MDIVLFLEEIMKKLCIVLLVLSTLIPCLLGQGNQETQMDEHHIEKLRVYFFPTREPEEIMTITAPLEHLLKDALKEEGYTVDNVDMSVGTSYEAVGLALASGSTDIGFISAITYSQYSKLGADVILTATRGGLNNDSLNPLDWNQNKPTVGDSEHQVSYYRSIILAGPSKKGRELAAKVNNGEKLSWDDLTSANWAVMSATSSSGYVYPTMWIQKNYHGKTVLDLSSVIQCDSYGSGFARLASKQVDLLCCFSDARRNYEDKWTTVFQSPHSIWDDTDVIAVSDKIMNDTISVSDNSPCMSDAFKAALQNAFIHISQTDEGKKVIAVYSHQGYVKAQDADYDNARKAEALMKSISQ